MRSRPHTYAVVREAEGRYRLARGDEAIEVGRKGYFVAEVSDRRNDVQNTFGVWRVQAAIDGEPYFEYRMDGFTHDLSRCCDAVSCYPVQVASRNEAIRLARLDRSPELFYPILRERGLVRAAAGERHRIRIEAETTAATYRLSSSRSRDATASSAPKPTRRVRPSGRTGPQRCASATAPG